MCFARKQMHISGLQIRLIDSYQSCDNLFKTNKQTKLCKQPRQSEALLILDVLGPGYL